MFSDFGVNCCHVMCRHSHWHWYRCDCLSHELLIEFLRNFNVFLVRGLVDNGCRSGHLNVADLLLRDAISVRLGLGRHFDIAGLIRGRLDVARIILGTVWVSHDNGLSVAIGTSGTVPWKDSIIGIISCAIFVSGRLGCGNGSNDE